MAKIRGQSLPRSQEPFPRAQQDKAKGFHPVILRSASFQGRGFQEVNVPQTEYRQRLHGWTTEEMARARGKSIDIEERRMLQQAMHRKAVEQVKRRAAEARTRQASASSLQRDKVPDRGLALNLHVVGLPVDFATTSKKSAQRPKGPPAKVNSQPIPSSRAASVGKTLPTKWGTKNAPSAASTRSPSEAGSTFNSRPSTSSSYKVQNEVASPMQPKQVAANTVAVQKQVEQLNQQVVEAVPVEALSKTSEERSKDGGRSAVRPEMAASANAVPLQGRIPPKLQRMPKGAGMHPNPDSAYEAKVGRAFIKALKAWWEQQQAERVPLPKPTSQGQSLPRKVRAASMGALQGNATQASHSDSNQWDSKASMTKDRRVRGAKYMARSVCDGRIRDP